MDAVLHKNYTKVLTTELDYLHVREFARELREHYLEKAAPQNVLRMTVVRCLSYRARTWSLRRPSTRRRPWS